MKTLWSFWDGKDDPLIRKCQTSWKKHLPNWDIRLLNSKDLNLYSIIKPQSFERLSLATKSDVVRLSLLYEYGGLWLDASVWLNDNLNILDQYNSYDYYGLRHKNNAYIESWFLYAPKPKNVLIYMWLQALNSILDSHEIEAHMAYLQPCTSNNKYFMVYQAYCFCVQQDQVFSDSYQRLLSNDYADQVLNFYSPWKSLASQGRVVKFTRKGREMYRYRRWPRMQLFIFAISVTVIVIVSIAIYCLSKRAEVSS